MSLASRVPLVPLQGEPNCAKPQAVTLHYCLTSHSHTAEPAQCTVKANLLGGTHLVVAGMATASKVHHLVLTLNQLVNADKLWLPEGGALWTLKVKCCQVLLNTHHDEPLLVELVHADMFSSLVGTKDLVLAAPWRRFMMQGRVCSYVGLLGPLDIDAVNSHAHAQLRAFSWCSLFSCRAADLELQVPQGRCACRSYSGYLLQHAQSNMCLVQQFKQLPVLSQHDFSNCLLYCRYVSGAARPVAAAQGRAGPPPAGRPLHC